MRNQLLTLAGLSLLACTSVQGESLPPIHFVVDHVASWPHHDESGLLPGQVAMEYDVYLPDGGTWDDAVRTTFAGYVRGGKLGAGALTPGVSWSEVADHPNIAHVMLTLAAPEAGTYWFELAGLVSQLRPLPGYTFLTPHADGLGPQYAYAMISFHTVGACQHPVEVVATAFSLAGKPTAWRVQFSEPVGALSATAQLPSASTPDTVQLAVAGPMEVDVTAGAQASIYQPKLPGDLIPGLAGTFATSGHCAPAVAAVDLAVASVPDLPRAAFDYHTLAALADPSIWGPVSK